MKVRVSNGVRERIMVRIKARIIQIAVIVLYLNSFVMTLNCYLFETKKKISTRNCHFFVMSLI